VAPDGSGDAPTIQAAIDSSAPQDVVELADGTFIGPGNRDLDLGRSHRSGFGRIRVAID
jgi:hypothetical protein